MMLDKDLARYRAHRNNVHRYRRLLETQLSDLERLYLERRLAEELSKLDELPGSLAPIALPPQTLPSAGEIQA